MKDNIFKSWKTSLVGLCIIGLLGYEVIVNKKPIDFAHIEKIMGVLLGIGFFFAKDGNTTHSKSNPTASSQEVIEGPDPNKEEK